jgi:hypothetical protein
MKKPTNQKHKPGRVFNQAEVATVLAALRFFQDQRGGFDHPEWYPQFNDVKPLSNAQIDDLCERINLGDLEAE